MGSFSFTCMASGLPIEAGDEVRFFLVTQNPNPDATGCGMTDFWYPRTFPIRAKYNDYGSIDSFEEMNDPAILQVWLDGFKTDLVEKGVGDNTCHDVSTLKTMTFPELLEALQERRVYVVRENDDYNTNVREAFGKKEHPAGVPTLQRVRALLTEAGHPLSTGMTSPGYLVDDEIGPFRIRIRTEGWDKAPNLGDIQALMDGQNFATMTCAGTDTGNGPEMWVRAKHGIKDFRDWKPHTEQPSARVEPAMIREDVWQAMANMEKPSEYEFDDDTKARYKSRVEKAWETAECRYRDAGPAGVNRWVSSSGSPEEDYWILKNPIPFTRGMADEFMDVVGLAYTGKIKPKVEKEFKQTVAQTHLIMRVMMGVRIYYRPSYSCGPQFGEWGEHLRFANMLVDLSKKAAQEDALEEMRHDSWWKGYQDGEKAAKKAAGETKKKTQPKVKKTKKVTKEKKAS